jgi:glycosyltransferase involved in cell wall biosynthesis
MPSARQPILFVAPSLNGGGMERVLLTLLRHLNRDQFVLHLAVLQAKGEFIREVPNDVVLHDLQSCRLRYALPGLLRLIWKLRPSAVMSTLAYISLGLIPLRPFMPRRTRLLVREASVVRYHLRDETQRPQVWGWLYRHLYKRADRVVCQSDWILKDFVEHFDLPPEKLVRIYNPVDVRRVREWAEMGGNPYSGPGPHLVTAGRLFHVKGFDILLRAMAAVLARLPDARLTILGQGPLQVELAEQARKLGIAENVRFAGFQGNPWPYFRHAQAFVLSSRHENLSNALLEALALGTPVIAADCPGGTREIHAASKGMMIVPPEDPHALAEAIIKVCLQPRAAQDDHPAKFDLHRALGEYSSLLLS